MHVVDAYGFFTFGTCSFEKTCEIFASPQDLIKAANIYEKYPNGFITLHMRNTHQPNRNIPQSFWLTLVERILKETDLHILQIGTSSDFAFGGNEKLIDMRGKFSIHELHNVIEKSKCYIGIDSAPLHIAGTTCTNIIGFFTTARSEYREPLRAKGRFKAIIPEIECYGCQVNLPLGSTMATCARGDNDCINRFDIEDVMQTFHQILD
jgi:ADP-heptose:LPS heptosyltransferase